MNEITRKQKVLMFLYEYYFGYNFYIKVMRLIGGPIFILIGINFYKMEYDKFSIAYSGFCFLFGIYYTLKPILWILFRWKQYESDKVRIGIDDDRIIIVEENVKSEVKFDLFRKILERPGYFSFFLNNRQKIYLPKSVLTDDQMKIIHDKTKQ
ncbi:MAG: YcxB family protein [Bacteroidales bacterium]